MIRKLRDTALRSKPSKFETIIGENVEFLIDDGCGEIHEFDIMEEDTASDYICIKANLTL